MGTSELEAGIKNYNEKLRRLAELHDVPIEHVAREVRALRKREPTADAYSVVSGVERWLAKSTAHAALDAVVVGILGDELPEPKATE